jgi:D-inositol-3-phosphate glycosyltransferase
VNKIAIVDHVGSKAGMDYYSSSLAKGFVESGCECSVFSNFMGIDSESIKYHTFYEGHSKDNPFLKFTKFILATIKSSYISKQRQVDLVIVHLFSANIITLLLLFIPRLFGLKVAVISHDISSFVDNDNSLIQNLIYNTLSNYIIVHNQFSFQELIHNLTIKDQGKVVIIKHGGYLDHIGKSTGKSSIRKQLKLEDDGKYMLFFGQIKDVKGLDILLQAMVAVPQDIKLIIAGKPWKSDFSFYDDLILKYGLSDRVIKMIRFIEDDEREKLFFATDVNILPYKVIYQSGVLLMAMSHGLPVIASDLPANKEIIIDGENGSLFKSEDAADLAKKVEIFFKDSDLQNNMSEKALETIKYDYNWREIGLSYLDMLNKK